MPKRFSVFSYPHHYHCGSFDYAPEYHKRMLSSACALDYDDYCVIDTKQITKEERTPLEGILELFSEDGTIINVEIQTLIGSGTGSLAYLATLNGQVCILKQFYPEVLSTEGFIHGTSNGITISSNLFAALSWRKRKKRFEEAYKQQALLHSNALVKPFIQPLQGLYRNSKNYCSIIGSFDGLSWDKHEPYSAEIMLTIIKEIATCVQSMNKAGFLVVDIKPSNFSVSIDADSKARVKLIDFGSVVKRGNLFCRRFQYSSETAPKEYKSTRKKDVGPWSEVYCVVAMLADQLFGHHKLKHMTGDLVCLCKPRYKEWVQKHYEIIEAILLQGLAEDYTKRFQSCDALLTELAKLP